MGIDGRIDGNGRVPSISPRAEKPQGKFSEIINKISVHAERGNTRNWVSDRSDHVIISESEEAKRIKKYGYEYQDVPITPGVVSRSDVISDLRVKRFFNVLMLGFTHFQERVFNSEVSGPKRAAYCVPMVFSFLVSAGTALIPGLILAQVQCFAL